VLVVQEAEVVSDDAVLEALAKGKARIRCGWTHSGEYELDGRVCALGAIGFRNDSVGMVPGSQSHARQYLEYALAVLMNPEDGHLFGSVSSFNDWPRVRKRHVLGLYDWAAELRRIDLAKGQP
jgi:hypothetical protein